jgi:hypothetical protein
MSKQKQTKAKEFFSGGVGDWERGKSSLKDLIERQKNRERSLREKLRIQDSSYDGIKGRARQGEANPDYTGPMGYAGRGTKDRMPGTTPTGEWSNKRRPKPTSKPKKSKPKQDPRNYI